MANHRTSPEDYIAKCKEVHGDRYDYSKTLYTTSRDYVIIICPVHGEFRQKANTHLSKRCGCQKCNLGVRKTTTEFVEQSIAIHGHQYDYANTYYIRKQDVVEIFCKDHGTFYQRPADHLDGSKCPSCAGYGFDATKMANLYVLNHRDLYKVGITNRCVEERLWQINNNCKNLKIEFSVLFSKSMEGYVAKNVESAFKQWAGNTYARPTEKFDGYTETFIGVDVNIAIPKILDLIRECEV